MTHDPLCPFKGIGRLNWIADDTNECWGCSLITRVRDDEANRKPEPPHDQHWYADNLCSYCIGYAAALDAALNAALSVTREIDKDEMRWAINALREGEK